MRKFEMNNDKKKGSQHAQTSSQVRVFLWLQHLIVCGSGAIVRVGSLRVRCGHFMRIKVGKRSLVTTKHLGCTQGGGVGTSTAPRQNRKPGVMVTTLLHNLKMNTVNRSHSQLSLLWGTQCSYGQRPQRKATEQKWGLNYSMSVNAR